MLGPLGLCRNLKRVPALRCLSPCGLSLLRCCVAAFGSWLVCCSVVAVGSLGPSVRFPMKPGFFLGTQRTTEGERLGSALENSTWCLRLHPFDAIANCTELRTGASELD